MDDSDLLRQFAATRSPQAMAHLVHAYAPIVYTACLRQLCDPSLADQASQVAFVLLVREAPQLLRRRTLLPFIYESACQAAQAIRQSAGASDNPSVTAQSPSYTGPTDWANLSPRIDSALMRLSARQREAVLLKYVVGLSLRDTADTLNLESTAAARLCAAGVARLRRSLADENQFLPAEALVAAMQAHAIRPAPDFAIQHSLAAALAVGASPHAAAAEGPAALSAHALAEKISADLRRRRMLNLAATAAGILLAAALTLTLISKLRTLAAAKSPATQPIAVASNTGPNSPLPSSSDASTTPPLDPPPPPPKGPAPRPVKPVDPVLAGTLLLAVRNGDAEAVERLVESEPDLVNAVDASTRLTAAQIAASLVDWQRRDSTRIAHYLIERGAVVDAYTAARAGHYGAVYIQVRLKPSLLNRPDDFSQLTLMQSAALIPGASPECEQVVDLLIRLSAQIDIYTAASFGRLGDLQQRLIKDPTLVSARVLGATPVHWAARPRTYLKDPLTIPKALLDKGADPRARDFLRDGVTPLHDAAGWTDQPAVVQLLLDRGAPVNERDDLGWTPLDYATARGRSETIALLTAKGGQRTTIDYPDLPAKTPRFLANVRAGNVQQVEALLGDTPELATTRGPTGETPLHLAAAAGHESIIDLLVKEKVDLNAPETNRFGGTPLHWATRHARLATLRHLISKGANPKLLNQRTGQSLLHIAARHHDDPALITFLLQQNIDPALKDHLGQTALDYATRFNHPVSAKTLSEVARASRP